MHTSMASEHDGGRTAEAGIDRRCSKCERSANYCTSTKRVEIDMKEWQFHVVSQRERGQQLLVDLGHLEHAVYCSIMLVFNTQNV